MDGGVDKSEGSRMPLRNGKGSRLVTASAPPQPRAIYQRPLKTASAPAQAVSEGSEIQDLPSNAFFPSNPWKQEEEGKEEHLPRSPIMDAGVMSEICHDGPTQRTPCAGRHAQMYKEDDLPPQTATHM